jgi:hypothetical protein
MSGFLKSYVKAFSKKPSLLASSPVWLRELGIGKKSDRFI